MPWSPIRWRGQPSGVIQPSRHLVGTLRIDQDPALTALMVCCGVRRCEVLGATGSEALEPGVTLTPTDALGDPCITRTAERAAASIPACPKPANTPGRSHVQRRNSSRRHRKTTPLSRQDRLLAAHVKGSRRALASAAGTADSAPVQDAPGASCHAMDTGLAPGKPRAPDSEASRALQKPRGTALTRGSLWTLVRARPMVSGGWIEGQSADRSPFG